MDRIGLSFTVIPEKTSDTLWISLRDPANPSRLWAKAVVRLEFAEAGKPQAVNIRLEPVDLMLAAEDRLWLELRFANAEKIVTEGAALPRLGMGISQDREKSLADVRGLGDAPGPDAIHQGVQLSAVALHGRAAERLDACLPRRVRSR